MAAITSITATAHRSATTPGAARRSPPEVRPGRRGAWYAAGVLSVPVLLAITSPAFAHDPGLSALTLELQRDRVGVHLVVARREIEPLVPMDTDADGTVGARELAVARPRLQALGAAAVALDGATIRDVGVDLDASDALHFRLLFAPPARTRLHLHVPLIARLALGHRQYVQVRDARGRLMAEHVLQANAPGFTVALDDTAAAAHGHGFRTFLVLGVEHIATGYDHLMFLLALLIVGPGPRAAAAIITSFTVAHSLTLALATFGVVRLASAVVEPLIAASVFTVGVENLRGRRLAPRWMLTFAFGLVHGLGFATALRDLGVGTTGAEAVVPLLAFNLGVEAGQLALAAIVLPLIWRAQRRPRVFVPVATACSMLVALAGAAWLVGKTLLT
jgi:hypothetical protein